MVCKIRDLLMIALFFICIVVPLLTINFASNVVSSIEKRQLTNHPILYNPDGSYNRNVVAEFEKWFGEHIGFREDLYQLAANMEYYVFHQSVNKRTVIGKQGEIFSNDNNILDFVEGNFHLDDVILQKIAESQQRIYNYVNNKGIEYLFVMTPDKSSIYPELLPYSKHSVSTSPIDIVYNYLKENTDCAVVNPKQSIIDAKSEGRIYPKYGGHMLDLGYYMEYNEICKALNVTPQKYTKIDTTYNDYYMNYNFLGDPYLPINHDLLYGIIPKNYAIVAINVPLIPSNTHAEEELYVAVKSVYDSRKTEFYNGNFFVYENPNAKDKRTVLVFSDSHFFLKLKNMLADTFAQLVVVINTRADYVFHPEFIEAVSPDIFILQSGEKTLNARYVVADEIPVEIKMPSTPK